MNRDYLHPVVKDTIDKCDNEYKWMVDSAVNIFYPADYFEVPKIIKIQKPAKINLVRSTTVEAIQDYGWSKYYSVLNFANPKNPGGGFLKGHNAQEESLCKASTLYPVIKKADVFYDKNSEDPFFSDKILYSKYIYFFKDYFGQFITPIKCDVITCAAPSYNFYDYERIKPEEHEEVIYSRFIKVLMASKENGVRNIILGAWGCGIFRNPPEVNARIFKVALEEYSRYFDNITFAIPDTKNYEIFSNFLL